MNEELSDAAVLSHGDVFWVGVPLPENNDNSQGGRGTVKIWSLGAVACKVQERGGLQSHFSVDESELI